MIERISCHIENAFAYNGFNLWLIGRGMGTRMSVAQQVTFVEHDEQMLFPPEPTVRLKQDEAQALMDALWQCGIRPTEGMGSAGALTATQEHNRTLREMAFRLLTLVEGRTVVGKKEL